MDASQPVENPALVQAIAAMFADQTVESETAMITALKQASFIVPVKIEPKAPAAGGGRTAFEQETTISFALLTDASGRPWYPTFTSVEELRKWNGDPGQQTLVLSFEDFGTLVDPKQHAGVVVDPFGQNLILNAERLYQILGKATQHTVEAQTEIALGTPAIWPQKLTDALSDYMKGQETIRAAWLRLMMQDNEASYLIVVDFDGDRQAVFNAIGQVASPCLKNGEFINMVPASEVFAQNAIQDTEPFYRR